MHIWIKLCRATGIGSPFNTLFRRKSQKLYYMQYYIKLYFLKGFAIRSVFINFDYKISFFQHSDVSYIVQIVFTTHSAEISMEHATLAKYPGLTSDIICKRLQ